jgi:plasmid stability protein
MIDRDKETMDKGPKRARGRPPAPEAERRGENLTLRVRSETKEALEQRAARSGRSLSAEAEFWLGQALLSEGILDQALDLAFGQQTAGLLLLLAKVMDDTGAHAGFKATHTLEGSRNWLSNPYAFDQVMRGVTSVMEVLRPKGAIVAPPGGKAGDFDIGLANATMGEGFAATWLGATAGEEIGADLAAWGAQIRNRLGPEVLKLIRERVELSVEVSGRRG